MEITEIIPTLPYEASVYFTGRCNLACPFCYQRAERSRRKPELTVGQWLAVIDELSSMQVFTVTVSGGEPFSHPQCRLLLERIAAGKMRFRLLTNGTLVGREEAEFLGGLKRCQKVQLSLDGFEPEHDAIRGTGAFRKTLNALSYLTDAGIPVVANTVVTRKNYRNIVSFARYLETLPLLHYRLTPYNECCGANGVSPEMLTPEELADLIAELDAHRGELSRVFTGNLPFSLLADIRSGGAPDAKPRVCANTTCAFGIHPDGAVVACPDAPGPVMGYAGKQPLPEIWNGEGYRAFRAKALAGVERSAPECRSCPFAGRCRKFCYLAHDDYYCRKKLADLLRKRGVKY